jgi:hypothetical protein
MQSLDLFTRRRIQKFIEDFRRKTGQLPTLRNLKEEGGFAEEVVKLALKNKMIDEFYVTLSNGTIVKGFKLVLPD